MSGRLRSSWMTPYPKQIRSSNDMVGAFFAVFVRCIVPMLFWLPGYICLVYGMAHRAWWMRHLPFSSMVVVQFISLLLLSIPSMVYLYMVLFRMQCLLDRRRAGWTQYVALFQTRWPDMLNLQWLLWLVGLSIAYLSMVPFLFVLIVLLLPLMLTPVLVVLLNHNAFSAMKRAYQLIRGQYWFSFVVLAKSQIIFLMSMMLVLVPFQYGYNMMPTWLQAGIVHLVSFAHFVFTIGSVLVLMHQLMLVNMYQADHQPTSPFV